MGNEMKNTKISKTKKNLFDVLTVLIVFYKLVIILINTNYNEDFNDNFSSNFEEKSNVKKVGVVPDLIVKTITSYSIIKYE